MYNKNSGNNNAPLYSMQTSMADYREIFDAVNDAIFVIDPESGIILDSNDAASFSTGHTPDELRGSLIEKYCDLQLSQKEKKHHNWFKEVIINEPQLLEWTITHKSGKISWAELSIKSASIGDKKVILAVSHDLTNRKRIDNALSISEERFRSIVENSHEAICIIDEKFRLIYVNAVLCKLSGISREELVNQDFRDFLSTSSHEFLGERYKERLRGEVTPVSYEHELELRNGHKRRVLVSTSLIGDSRGEKYFVAQILDISDRYLSELELRESERKYRQLVENANDAIIIVQNNEIKFANKRTLEIFDCSDQEIHEHKFSDFIYQGDIDKFETENPDDNNNDNDIFYQSVRIITNNGTLKWAELNKIDINLNQNSAFLFFIRDITQQKKLEDLLKISQKMEAIGTLAGGIAHDFNNILSPIIGYTELTLDALDQESRPYINLLQVYKAANRAKDLVLQILTFSRQADQEPKPLQMEIVIKEALKLLRASIPSTINFKINLDKDCPLVLADPTQIHQIVMNLCTNAYHAMGEKGGTLGITLTTKTIQSEDALDQPVLTPGTYAVLTITDTGYGMENTILQRIFDPFFTTKEKGTGTGMGLAVVHGIVKDHKGHIEVYSEPGQGSTFRIYFPSENIAQIDSKSDNIIKIPRGTENILLVDDEQAIVNLLKQMLEQLGYTIISKTSSKEASEYFKSNPDSIDLVITDQVMPVMTGDMLSREIHSLRPELPIILCTGFSDYIDKAQAKVIGIQDIVMKPVLRSELANTIRKTLDKKSK